MLVRRIARPLLASSFIYGGIDTLRNPQSRVPGARPVVEAITGQADKQLPVQVPRDVEQWVRIDAASSSIPVSRLLAFVSSTSISVIAACRAPDPIASILASCWCRQVYANV